MKKLCFISFGFLVFMLGAYVTHAQTSKAKHIRLVSIRADDKHFAGETYYMGLTTDDDGKRTGMYFENEYRTVDKCTGKQPHFFDEFNFEQLAQSQLIIHGKKNADDCKDNKYYDVAKISLKGKNFTISYKNDARKGDDGWIKHDYTINCDTHNNCAVKDNETDATITHVRATVHHCYFFIPCGIDELEGT